METAISRAVVKSTSGDARRFIAVTVMELDILIEKSIVTRVYIVISLSAIDNQFSPFANFNPASGFTASTPNNARKRYIEDDK